MNNTKEKRAKLQIITAILVFTVILFAEIYLMINYPNGYIPIISLAVVALISVYIMINAIITINEEKEAMRSEYLENIYRSEKASFIMLKKCFDEIEEKLNEIKDASKLSAEEVINAQKGISKVIINRSKENSEAIINLNSQIIDRINEVEQTQDVKITSLSKEQILKVTDIGTQTEIKLQDILVQLKDTELRLNQSIMSGSKVIMQAAPTYVESSVQETPVVEEVVEELEVEDVLPIPDLSEPIPEPIEEDIPPMPDLSDPNKAMSPDEIAALFANMAPSESEPAPEPVPEPVVEEKPPMPDLSDPNKVMSPEEIAALIANL